MIETQNTARINAAYRKAHAERGQAFAAVIRWVFARNHAPLNPTVLTESSRCA